MNDELVPDRWTQVQDAFALPSESSIHILAAMMLLGGVLGVYFRFLYRWTSPQSADGSIARVFPLLTIVTIAVIGVVKSSLALSLGLVGALSIVRFRAAIKDPGELVYLFLCIGVGLALGAVQVWLALALALAATLFGLIFDRLRPGARRGDAFLTLNGDAGRYFGEELNALDVVRRVFPHLTVERCEVDGDEGLLRVKLGRIDPDEVPKHLARLKTELPDCRISWLNAALLP